MNFTYIVCCADGSFYTGWTNDLDGRMKAHNLGKGARYTRSRLPVELVYSRSFPTRSQAMSHEYRLKQMSRAEKVRLIEEERDEQNSAQ
ncbi:MAG: GIY-YIG nuclease family protein [Cyanobacteria bacterium HKST-UBA02]|nr:GIY-YIG nuclease family protein [Cyanobacteria bacterium HKST-UBA02]